MSNIEFNDRIVAKAAHDIWAHWMKYQFTQGQFTPDGEFVVPFENVARWQRQMLTDFKDLSPEEQKSDFEIADHFIDPLLREMEKALSEAQADARVFSGSYNALAEDFGRLKEENERLRKFIHSVQDDKLHTSSECQSLKSENERLRAGIGRALGELEAGKPGDAESILEALHDA